MDGNCCNTITPCTAFKPVPTFDIHLPCTAVKQVPTIDIPTLKTILLSGQKGSVFKNVKIIHRILHQTCYARARNHGPFVCKQRGNEKYHIFLSYKTGLITQDSLSGCR